MKTRFNNFLRRVFFFPPLERLVVFFTDGTRGGSFVSKFPPNHYQYRKPSYRTATRDGIQFQLDISDLVDWHIYFGFVDLARTRLYSLVKEGDIVLDVGANVGETALNMSKIVGENGKVFAFEPFPGNFERMSANVELNSSSNIFPVKIGLGDCSASLLIGVVDSTNAGMNRVVDVGRELPRSLKTEEVEVIELDEFVAKRGIRHIDVIKIDVEGFEMKVIRGATASLKKYKPIVFLELDNDNLTAQGDSAREVIRFLESHDYVVSRADDDSEIGSKMDFTEIHFDIYAVHSSWAEQSSEIAVYRGAVL